MNMKKRALVIVAVVWMVLVVAGVSSAVTMAMCGASFMGANTSSGDGAVLVTDAEYEIIDRYSRLDEVRSILQTEYYLELDGDELVLGAIRGMMDAVGDPYTFYYTPEEMNAMTEHTQGVYEGVGLLLSADKDGELVVLRIFSDTPAEASGIAVGDRIVEVNGEPVSAQTDKEMDEAIARIKGDAQNSVTVRVRRGDQLLDFSLSSATVNIDRVEYEMLSGQIGYIGIYEFMGNDVDGFKKGLNALSEQGMRALIIDVRSNPGGLLTDVVEIADLLLPKGLIVYTQDRYGRREEYYSDESALDIPMAVLVNGMSASASEILAGALQDYGVAAVVGEKTYGKGIVQTVIPFRSDYAGMQLTTARYYTPKGRAIHGVGIEPDVEISLDDELLTSGSANLEDQDAQVRGACELLLKELEKRS